MEFKNPNADVIKSKKLYIFDMDGTIYLGGRPFDFAKRFIKNLRASGRRVLFFTNNASHTSPFYLAKLERLGFEPGKDEIITRVSNNIPGLKLACVNTINVLDILNYDKFIVTEAAVKLVEEVYD
jgi:ribosomal protein L4